MNLSIHGESAVLARCGDLRGLRARRGAQHLDAADDPRELSSFPEPGVHAERGDDVTCIRLERAASSCAAAGDEIARCTRSAGL